MATFSALSRISGHGLPATGARPRIPHVGGDSARRSGISKVSAARLQRFLIPSSESDVQLEVVAARPPGAGAFPTLVFNHGSTGRGQSRALFKRTVCPAIIANYFVERGWMVLFPQRRGRGKSGGYYGEGLASDGSGYSCDVDIALAGFSRAIEDMDAVVHHLRSRSDADQERLAIGGVSRGGILAIAYAGMQPDTFRAAINFNGGWLGRACPSHEVVNPMLFERGAKADISTLWLHGSYDQYYRIAHCRGNFERFRSAGGHGEFIAAPMGHALMFKPKLWKEHMDRYLERVVKA